MQVSLSVALVTVATAAAAISANAPSRLLVVPTITVPPAGGWLPPGPTLSRPQQLWLTQRAAAEPHRAPRATVTMICGMPVIKADPEFDKKIVAKAPPHLDEKMAREIPCRE